MSTTIEETLDDLYYSSSSTTDKGSKFERLVTSYLRGGPQYAERFDEVGPSTALSVERSTR